MASVDHFDSGSHFLHFILCNVPGYVNAAWGSIWVAIIGEIWRHMNNHILKDVAIDHSKIFSLLNLRLSLESLLILLMLVFSFLIDVLIC